MEMSATASLDQDKGRAPDQTHADQAKIDQPAGRFFRRHPPLKEPFPAALEPFPAALREPDPVELKF